MNEKLSRCDHVIFHCNPGRFEIQERRGREGRGGVGEIIRVAPKGGERKRELL